MNAQRRVVLVAFMGVAIGLAAAPSGISLTAATPLPPVVKVKNQNFGNILQSKNRLPLYYWARERQTGGKIRCTRRCARVWPPLVVKSQRAVPARLPNIKGTFGVVRRPDGRLQVTFRGLALYAYHNDPPNTVLCDNVDGWFVMRV
jgi:predicted lipoprotein with Yx(FWY)xxD motif